MAIGDTEDIACGGVDCMQITAVKVAYASRYKDPSGFYDDKPAAGDEYLAIEVRYIATGAGASYNPWDWGLYVDSTVVSSFAPVLNGPKPELGAGSLAIGKKATAWVVWEIPKTGSVSMVYQPGGSAIFEVSIR